ncbi:gluconokinase [Tessaracoccus caeni]|uniref:gluconokinase n=1 Tax=Tessaracoccus caeni TaxID=3031239 RepID=UPI0023DBA25D|nr:FGGY family carbohydrate kinase [Tessaracoccus caeni]MDF1489309.1 FGGY family carbohydrate kinase [Tessaracoccus caeni]
MTIGFTPSLSPTRFRVSKAEATAPYVLGLDVGSGGSRAAVYDATGREVKGRRFKVEHVFNSGTDGTSTIDADQVVAELLECIERSVDKIPQPISAIGIDTFASTLVPVDANGNALGPCITYADTRSRDKVTQLRESLDVATLHDLTGARIAASYMTPRLVWLREDHPDVFARARHFMALGEYIAFKLLGTPAIGTAAAAWGGMLNRRTGEYVPELIEAAGVDPDSLGAPHDPSDVVPVAGSPLAKLVPEVANAVWVPVVGDGLGANIGTGAQGGSTWGISTATSGAIRMLLNTSIDSLPSGLWAYRVDAQRTLFGSAMSDCGRVLDFAQNTFRLPPYEELNTDSLFAADPSSGTPLVVPFLSGERGTKWRDGVRALFAGVSAATTPEQWLRGSVEGLALSFLRIADQMKDAGGTPERIVLSGSMTNLVPGWLQILADALGQAVEHIDIRRATMRGTAVLALEQVSDQPLAEVPVRARVEPVAGRAEYYRERLARFEDLADHA